MPDLIDRLLAALQQGAAPSTDFDLNQDAPRPQPRALRPAGVLVPVSLAGPEPTVILTKRASSLKHHPGQIAFPGGKVDPGDAGPRAAALREAHEEIGLPPGAVDIIADLPTHETITAFTMHPFLGLVRSRFDPVAEPGEVEEIFEVPLAHVLDVSKFSLQGRFYRGHRREYFTVPYGPYYIWGASARILHRLAARVGAP